MKNYLYSGDSLYIPVDFDAKAGDVVVAGKLVGVASADATAGDRVVLVTRGVFWINKTANDVFAIGDGVYWNATTKRATATAIGNALIGVATEPAVASAAHVQVKVG
ncbi:DUF2190 family protein [Paenirhodobacter populi]|uniref:DUF2190 family protein n=1 Tax=Paenirhodobacter populi TaxID=2306993 RepID=UPI000FE3198E|nr:DUF2190 family protein [Sinirhodobacter populi]RWR07702.1 DUF2190 family protein [Sinirhodobacter populi]